MSRAALSRDMTTLPDLTRFYNSFFLFFPFSLFVPLFVERHIVMRQNIIRFYFTYVRDLYIYVLCGSTHSSHQLTIT